MNRRLILATIAILLAGCRRDGVKLEEVQKVAYATKPAVVRVNAYATAEFRYTADAVLDVERMLAESGADLVASDLPPAAATVDTGAGGSGSGFIVHRDGYILTSGHIVAPTRDRDALQKELRRNGAIAVLVKHFPVAALRGLYKSSDLESSIAALAAAGKVENVRVVTRVELSNGETFPFQVKQFSPALAEGGSDLALLKVERRELPTVPLGDSDATRVGESVWAVGYPAVASSTDEVIGGWLSRESDLEPTFNPGTITAIKRDVTNAPVFQTNVAIYRGNSGGPAVNRSGAVVGISTWGHKDVEQIKFLVPVNVARPMLVKSRVGQDSTSQFDAKYRAALDAASEGDWRTAQGELAAASKLYRNSPDAIRFARDIERALAAAPGWKRYVSPAVAGVLAIAAFVIVASLWFGRVRRKVASRIDLPPVTREVMVTPEGGQSQSLGRFTILNGTRAGERLGLGGSGIRIGREASVCEIVLENPKVSRLHAEVVKLDGRVVLVDRNSSNGTYVNDQKIDRRALNDGDIIYFGGRNAIAVAYHV